MSERRRIGYGKVGRVLEMDSAKWGESGGDNEPPVLLRTLAQRNPDVDWVCVGRNSGWVPDVPNIINPWQEWNPLLKAKSRETIPDIIQRMDDVTLPTFAALDGMILWLGQHGTSNTPIPKVGDPSEFTSPQISFVKYTSFLLRGTNAFRESDPLEREEVYLLPDVRNYLKARDLKNPLRRPILGQFTWSRTEWVERYGDTRSVADVGFNNEVINTEHGMWKTKQRYIASGLELVGIPTPPPLASLPDFDSRHPFGLVINEARNYGMKEELTRLHAMQHYILPLDPTWVVGKWTDESLATMGRQISPAAYGKIFHAMKHTKSTFTTPSSGSGWATAKPWEAFGCGTVCFFHPAYDTQGHVVPTLEQAKDRDDELAHLARWLRVTTPEQLAKRVSAVAGSRGTYEWIAGAQYRHLSAALNDQRCVKMIERRVGL